MIWIRWQFLILFTLENLLFLIIHFLGEVNESLPLLQPNTETLPTNSDDLVEVKVEDPGQLVKDEE